MTLLFQVTSTLPFILASISFCLASLDVTYEWKYIDYVWKCNKEKAAAIAAGTYNRTKIIPNDVQPLPDGRVLVTTPKYFNNPASLSTISSKTGDGGPLLAPYPDWTWHNRKDCQGITSVNRVFLDDCNRLWLVDSGKIGNHQVCPAKILAFNPENDRLIKQLIIPNDLTHNANNKYQGRLEISGVETHGKSCKKTWVYMADPEGYGLVISDGSDIWRLNADVFNPDPSKTEFSIAGENFTLSIGLSSFHMTPAGFLEKPSLIFKAMSAVNGYGITLEDLHKSKSGREITFYKLNFTEPSQELMGDFSKTGGIFLTTFSTETLLACWNIRNPLQAEYIGYLETNETTLQFPSGLKITEDSNSGSQTVTIMTNRLQRFILGTVDFNEVNFRILTGDVETLVNGTVCEPMDHEIKTGLEDKNFYILETLDDTLFKRYRLF